MNERKNKQIDELVCNQIKICNERKKFDLEIQQACFHESASRARPQIKQRARQQNRVHRARGHAINQGLNIT